MCPESFRTFCHRLPSCKDLPPLLEAGATGDKPVSPPTLSSQDTSGRSEKESESFPAGVRGRTPATVLRTQMSAQAAWSSWGGWEETGFSLAECWGLGPHPPLLQNEAGPGS